MWLLWVIVADVFWTSSHFLMSKSVKLSNPYQVTFIVGLLHLLALPFIPFLDLEPFSTGDFILLGGLGALGVLMLFTVYCAYTDEYPEVVVPIVQLSAVSTLLFAHVILEETLSSLQFTGFSLILVGGIMVSLKKPTLNFTLSKAFLWGFITSILLGMFYTGTKYLVKDRSFEETISIFILSYPGGLVGLLLLFLFSSSFRRQAVRTFSLPGKTLGIITISEIVGSMGFFPMLFAFQGFSSAGIVKASQSSLLQILTFLATFIFSVRRNDIHFQWVGSSTLLIIIGLWLAIF